MNFPIKDTAQRQPFETFSRILMKAKYRFMFSSPENVKSQPLLACARQPPWFNRITVSPKWKFVALQQDPLGSGSEKTTAYSLRSQTKKNCQFSIPRLIDQKVGKNRKKK